jgi:hypothetical protein
MISRAPRGEAIKRTLKSVRSDPKRTRALQMLRNKTLVNRRKKHDNIPLWPQCSKLEIG